MTFARDNGAADPEALAEFEANVGRLPDDYREFIAVHNGVDFVGTASLSGPDRWAVDGIYGVQSTEFWHEDYPKNSIPVASDGMGNSYLMGLEGESRGRIYFRDIHLESERNKSVSQLPQIAQSFAEFLGRIQDFDPDDPEDEALFHELQERANIIEKQRQAILAPKKPWWRLW